MTVRWSSDLLAQILARYRAGETLTAMAREYGIERARMQQVKSRAELLERWGNAGKKRQAAAHRKARR